MKSHRVNNSPSGILMAIDASGIEYAIGPPVSWSAPNGTVIVDHIAAVNQEGHLIAFFKYEGINWKAVNIYEKTGVRVASERPCAWLFDENGVTKERLAVVDANGEVYVFSWHSGSDWTAENISSITNIKIKGALTAWVVPNGNQHVEHIAGRNLNNELIVFFRQTNGQWNSVNVSQITGQKIGNDPISWTDNSNPVFEKIAVISPHQEILIFVYTPSSGWTFSKVSHPGSYKIDSRLAHWKSGINKTTALVGRDINGDLLVFRHDPIDNAWQVENISAQTGQKVLSEPCEWGMSNAEYLAAQGVNDDLIVFSKAQDSWHYTNVTGVTNKKIFHAPTSWISKISNVNTPHLAAGGAGKRMLDFYFKPREGWQVIDVSINASGRVLYGVSQKGGVWRSDDYSARWKQCAQMQPPPGKDPSHTLNVPVMTDIAVSPENPNIVLAATGLDFRKQPVSATGLYRSADGGKTWDLVFQFKCNGTTNSVGQILFDPLNNNRIFAVGGCPYFAVSENGGNTWESIMVDSSGQTALWHVAISDKPGRSRYIAVAGQDNKRSVIWSSVFGSNQWKVWKTGFPDNCCEGTTGTKENLNSIWPQINSHIMTFIPGSADEIFLVAPLGSQSVPNGPTYWSQTLKDGEKCCYANNCLEGTKCGFRGTIWKGNLASGAFSQLPGPPIYSTGDYSGVEYIYTKSTDRGYLVFFSDNSKVHVSDGMPTSGSWHRLCGSDASEHNRSGKKNPDQYVHVDPHDLALSADFDITLKASDQPAPYHLNSELDDYIQGRIWMANDGGIYLSEDGGKTWLMPDMGPNNQHLVNITGVSGVNTVRIQPPALYFGATHNDDFFSPDGGQTWYDAIGGCGDCDAWFVEPGQKRVLRLMPRSNSFDIWTGGSGITPDARNQPDISIPYPTGTFNYAQSGSTILGAKPLVFTMANEQPLPHGDYFTIMELYKKDANGVFILNNKEKILDKKVLIRAKNTFNQTGRTDAFAIVGDTLNNKNVFLPINAKIYQAAGGHADPTFFIGDGYSLWKSEKNAGGELEKWSPIVPGNGSNRASRFFVNPYNAEEIYLLDDNGVKRSVDGGKTWPLDAVLDSLLTEGGKFLYKHTNDLHENRDASLLNDMIFHKEKSTIRFALGIAGVFYSQDGKNWTRILDVRALPGRPVAGWYDPYTNPADKSLYVAFHSRGLVRLHPIY